MRLVCLGLGRLGWLGLALLGQVRSAVACGCFANPNVATPVLQAGERILFAKDGDQVTAYIQIQYQGSADHFGWLLPLPSVPTLQLCTDELFDQLGKHTQPLYRLTTQTQTCNGTTVSTTRDQGGSGCSGSVAMQKHPAR